MPEPENVTDSTGDGLPSNISVVSSSNFAEFEGVGVGNKIRGKYADQSEAFLLQIPEPTFYIDFKIRGFVKQKYKKDAQIKGLKVDPLDKVNIEFIEVDKLIQTYIDVYK